MNNYYANLPKKRMGSGILFFDEVGHILIVKPRYKEGWEIPGGVVEANESPRAAALRELAEELGGSFCEQYKKQLGEQFGATFANASAAKKDAQARLMPLLSVDYIDGADGKGDRLMFVFDGGVLDAAMLSLIALNPKELSEYRLVPLQEALTLLHPLLKIRIASSVAARQNGRSGLYLEGGVE